MLSHYLIATLYVCYVHTHTYIHMCMHTLFIDHRKEGFDSVSCKLAYRSFKNIWNTFYDYRFLY